MEQPSTSDVLCWGAGFAGFPGFALNGLSHEGFARAIAANPFCMRGKSGKTRDLMPAGLLSRRSLLIGGDVPETLPCAVNLNCSIGADGEQCPSPGFLEQIAV